MKYALHLLNVDIESRLPRGRRGLKYTSQNHTVPVEQSPPSREAWIEIPNRNGIGGAWMSPPSREASVCQKTSPMARFFDRLRQNLRITIVTRRFCLQCVSLTKKMQARNRCAATTFKYITAYRKVFWAVQKNYPKGHSIQVLPDGMFSSAGSSSL